MAETVLFFEVERCTHSNPGAARTLTASTLNTRIMKKKSAAPRIEPYHHPAAGWGALKAVAINLIKEKVTGGNYRTLLRQNQPDGFDCPGCAWPDRQHASTFEFCENGVKAVAAEATSKRVTPEFFAAHTVTELLEQTDFELKQHNHLTKLIWQILKNEMLLNNI